MDFLNKITKPLGGPVRFGIICIVVLVLYMIGGAVSSVSRSKDKVRQKEHEAESSVQASVSESAAVSESLEMQNNIIEAIPGTYLGHNGSILVMKSDNTAFYYFYGTECSLDNTWSFENGTLTITFPSLQNCNVYASLSSPVGLNNFILAGVTDEDVLYWDTEVYTHYSEDTDDLDESACITIILSELDITPAQTSAASSPDGSGTGSANIRDVLDEYEGVVNDMVTLQQRINNASGNDYAENIQILADYAALLERYNNICEQLEQVDQSSLTEEDYAYYLAVMERTNAAMASIGQ